ncbi:MAG TPA: hypothetical protein VIJ39_02595 [Solirubrobacteraceae bacterium]
MSPSESRNGREADSIPEGGILAALPRARPQRASARRAAARSGAATKTSTVAKTKPVRAAAVKKPIAVKKPASTKPASANPVSVKPASAKSISTKRRAAKPRAKPVEPPVPKQGYEPEDELELGKTVHPPSGVELMESVADIVGELANSSIAAGGRLLKDAFSLLRRP